MRDPQGREPPRGPKALVDPPRGPPPGGGNPLPAGPRDRSGFAGRDDYRDRDFRDGRDERDSPAFGRERDRDWGPREREFDRDRRRSPPPSRRSPVRESREYSREAEVDRSRRNSRDGPLSANSISSEPIGNTAQAFTGRGGYGRGRGRGEADYRGRGRGGYGDDRVGFAPRSRSRDRRWEWDRDRDFDIRRSGREEREQAAERYKRRMDPQSSLTPTTPRPQSTAPHPGSADSRPSVDLTRDPSSGRRPSSISLSSVARDSRNERPDTVPPLRSEASRDRQVLRAASPPQAPQVPAFGSVSSRPTIISTPTSNVWKAPSPNPSSQVPLSAPQGPKAVPSGPKALTPHQPPTGPKADRATTFTSRDPRDGDSTHRPAISMLGRPQATSTTQHIPHTSEVSPPSRPRALPLGPSTTPSRPSSSGHGTSRPEDAARFAVTPSQPSQATPIRPAAFKTSPTLAGVSIPTGPRLDRAGRGKSNSWLRGGSTYLTGRGNAHSMGKPYSHGDENSRAISAGRGNSDLGHSLEPPVKDFDSARKQLTESSRGLREDEQKPLATVDINAARPSATKDIEMDGSHIGRSHDSRSMLSANTLNSSSYDMDVDEEMDDDDPADNIQLFEKEDDKHIKKLKILHAKIQAEIRDLRSQAMHIECVKVILSRHGDELREEGPESVKDEMDVEPPVDQLIPFENAEKETADLEMDDISQALQAISPPRINTPPIERLPFLTNPPPPFSEIDILQVNADLHQSLKDAIQARIVEQRVKLAHEESEIMRWYQKTYTLWRQNCDKLDQHSKDALPDQTETTRGAELSEAAALPLPIDGRRGGKFQSELDFQRALRESELDAIEQQRKKEQANQEKLDLAKEAIIPPMLNQIQRKAIIFQDISNLIPIDDVPGVFEYNAPFRQFTEEEQEIFTKAYMYDPKRFGAIAEKLPGRTYPECIRHYYSTKDQERYKQKLSKRGGRKKGRRTVGQGRAKTSNALMANMRGQGEFDNEEENPVLPVTDTGRPKRAAAPVFGDVPVETDASAVAQGRRNLSAVRNDHTPDAPPERVAKRSKTTSTREKSQKRARNPPLVAAPTPSPQKVEKVTEPEPTLEELPRPEEVPWNKDRESAALLTNLQASSRPLQAPSEPVVPAVEERAASAPASRIQDVTKIAKQSNHKDTASSSYWSVPEQQDFPRLLAYYGTNWEEFAEHMTSKSAIMIKNYYSRKVQAGYREFEDISRRAMDSRARGEDLGAPPAVQAVPKRRYDTPQATSSNRLLAPSVEGAEMGESIGSRSGGHLQAQSMSPQYGHASRYAPLAQARSPQSKPQTLSQPQISPTVITQPQQVRGPQHPHAPRAGYFTADVRQVVPTATAPQQQQQQQQHQQQPQQPPPQQQQQQPQPQQQHPQPQPQPQQQQTPMQSTHQTQQQIAPPQLVAQVQRDYPAQSNRPQYAQPQPGQQQIHTKYQALSTGGGPVPIELRAYQQHVSPQTGPTPSRSTQHEPATLETKSSASNSQINHHTQHQSGLKTLIEPQTQPVYGMPGVPHQAGQRPTSTTFSSEPTRPVSISTPPSVPPSRPAETIKKTSSIAALLNNDSEEPIPRRRLAEQVALAPTPPPRSPRYSVPPNPQSLQQHNPSRDPRSDQRYIPSSQGYRPPYMSASQPPRTLPELHRSGSPVVSPAPPAPHSHWYSNHPPPYQRHPQQLSDPPSQPMYSQPPPGYRAGQNASPPPPPPYGHTQRPSFSERPGGGMEGVLQDGSRPPLPPSQGPPPGGVSGHERHPSLHHQYHHQHHGSQPHIRGALPTAQGPHGAADARILYEQQIQQQQQHHQQQQQQQQQQQYPPRPGYDPARGYER